MVFDLSVQLVALMSWVEGPFCAFWMLALESDFTMPQLDFLRQKLMTMESAGAIHGKFLPDGGVQWLRMKLWTCSIGRCMPYRTGTSSWPSKRPSNLVFFSFIINSMFARNISQRPCYGQYKVKPSYVINLIGVNNLLICLWCLPLMPYAVLATICNGGRAICQKYE